MAYDLYHHLRRQMTWSEKTFGPGDRSAGVIDHIRKELLEIEAAPGDLEEWIDVVILAFDGAWRSGHTADEIVIALVSKLEKNMRRTWPDWQTVPRDRAIEHDRTAREAVRPRVCCPGCGGFLARGYGRFCASCAGILEDSDIAPY